MMDIVEQLRAWGACKVGGPFPDGVDANNWGPPLTKMHNEAADEIERLRADVMIVKQMAMFKEKT